MTLEERLQRLEDDRAIRDLKARYLRACDLKQPDIVRDCLAPKGAVIAYEGFPEFTDREPFVEIYEQMGCVSGIYDIHHGANGIISFEGADRATGRWSLTFHNINLVHRTLTLFGVEYVDVYVREGGRWWIAETRSTRPYCTIQSVDVEGNAKVIAMGEPPAVFGEQ